MNVLGCRSFQIKPQKNDLLPQIEYKDSEKNGLYKKIDLKAHCPFDGMELLIFIGDDFREQLKIQSISVKFIEVVRPLLYDPKFPSQ